VIPNRPIQAITRPRVNHHDPDILDTGVGENRLRRVAVENALTFVLEFPDRIRVELQHDVADSHVPESLDDVPRPSRASRRCCWASAAILPRMGRAFFRPVLHEPDLWEYERCIEVETEDANLILFSVVPTKEAASGMGFQTVMPRLTKTLGEDTKKRAESESRKVKSKWLDAPEDWGSMPPADRTRWVLRSMGYVRVPRAGPEHWRRTLDQL